MVHKLMDAMSSAEKLRGAGLTPHFHAERSSNGSCGGPPPVRRQPGRWKNPRRRPMSQFHSELRSVPLGRSVHGPVTCQQPVPMTLSTFLHGVEASHLAGCRDSHARFPFLFLRYLARVSFAQQSFVSAYMWHRASRFLGIRSLLLRTQFARAVFGSAVSPARLRS